LTILWVVLALMLALAVAGLTIPLVRRYDAAAREGETVAAVIRTQLDEVDGQLASGAIDAEAAAALRTELKRRLLVEARARPVAVRLLSERASARRALIVAALTALVATGVYAVRGRPDLASTAPQVAAEVAAVTGTAPATDSAVNAMLGQLEARAAQTPGDAPLWQTLGSAYFAQQRFADAATAYARAAALRPKDAAPVSAQGEALTQAANGVVTPEAAKAFQAALALDPNDPRARYFTALARDQAGDHQGAIDAWVALLNGAPADAPWAPALRRFVEQAAADAKIDLAGRLKPAPAESADAASPPEPAATPAPPVLAGAANARGPDAAQVAAAGQMSTGDRAAFIKQMVENLAAKLAANPRDADGWIRLIRARKVLGDDAAAKAALASGRKAFADDPASQQAIASAAAALGVS